MVQARDVLLFGGCLDTELYTEAWKAATFHRPQRRGDGKNDHRSKSDGSTCTATTATTTSTNINDDIDDGISNFRDNHHHDDDHSRQFSQNTTWNDFEYHEEVDHREERNIYDDNHYYDEYVKDERDRQYFDEDVDIAIDYDHHRHHDDYYFREPYLRKRYQPPTASTTEYYDKKKQGFIQRMKDRHHAKMQRHKQMRIARQLKLQKHQQHQRCHRCDRDDGYFHDIRVHEEDDDFANDDDHLRTSNIGHTYAVDQNQHDETDGNGSPSQTLKSFFPRGAWEHPKKSKTTTWQEHHATMIATCSAGTKRLLHNLPKCVECVNTGTVLSKK